MIKAPNFTQTPNELFDEIMKVLNDSELRVFLSIIRKTFGWNKKRDRISITQIEDITGLSRQGVLNGLYGKDKITGLIGKQLVLVFESSKGNEYEVNVVDQSSESSSQPGLLPLVNGVDQVKRFTSQPCRHTKDTTLKTLSKEIYSEITNHYSETYESIKNAKPFIDYPSVNKRIKDIILGGATKENILKAIDNAKKDSWITDNCGFSIMTILSGSIFMKLVNAPIQNSFPKKNNSAPGGLRVFARDTQLDMEEVK